MDIIEQLQPIIPTVATLCNYWSNEEQKKMDGKEIVEFIKSKAGYLKIANDLYDIYNRNLYPHLESRVRAGLQSEAAAREAMSRASTVNILPKIVDKLSQCYKTEVTRTSSTQGIVDGIVSKVRMSKVMREANKYLNLHRCVAIEPVFSEDKTLERLRVIPANKFLVMDDGTIDGNITAFIKILSDKQFQVYTAQEFFFVDENGAVSDVTPNEFGFIPVVYLKRDCLTVMPPEDKDTIEMVTLLPLLLTDMNYALKFQCFSIIYTIDCEISDMTLAPNALWPLKATDGYGGNAKPSIGTVEPKVAVKDILDALFTQYSMWLESRSIKLGSLDRGVSAAGSLSGIAKAIDNADVEADIEYQRELFEEAEEAVFAMLSKLTGSSESEVEVEFKNDSIIPETPTEHVDRIIKEMSAGLTTLRMGIRAVHPSLSEQEIEAIAIEGEMEEVEPASIVAEEGMSDEEV